MSDASHVARATRIARATLDKDAARIVFGDGRESVFHLLWLRDNDPAGFHPQTEERIFDIVDFAAKAGDAPAARAATAAADGGSVRIDWNDGESIFAADFLRAHAYDAQSLVERAERPTLWDSETLPQPPRFDCAQIFDDKAARLRWLRALADFGIALVENTPRPRRRGLRFGAADCPFAAHEFRRGLRRRIQARSQQHRLHGACVATAHRFAESGIAAGRAIFALPSQRSDGRRIDFRRRLRGGGGIAAAFGR